MPMSIAMPTVNPTRCPTPIKASDREVPIEVAPAPSLNVAESDDAATFM